MVATKRLKRVVEEVKGREPNYIDALNLMMKETNEKVYATGFVNSAYYDTGSKIGYLKAVVDFGLTHKDTNGEFASYIKEVAKGL